MALDPAQPGTTCPAHHMAILSHSLPVAAPHPKASALRPRPGRSLGISKPLARKGPSHHQPAGPGGAAAVDREGCGKGASSPRPGPARRAEGRGGRDRDKGGAATVLPGVGALPVCYRIGQRAGRWGQGTPEPPWALVKAGARARRRRSCGPSRDPPQGGRTSFSLRRGPAMWAQLGRGT